MQTDIVDWVTITVYTYLHVDTIAIAPTYIFMTVTHLYLQIKYNLDTGEHSVKR